jgi:VIT1/CCC1 family predicted Fe2+/Mn2+ transporter
MRNPILLILLFVASLANAQPAVKAIEDKELGLQERYQVMKAGSQTYESYKVIRENILDGFWKITLDSVKDIKKTLAASNAEITSLKIEIQSLKDSIKTQQASVEDILFDSTHINVLGIPFSKSVFIVIVASIIGALIFLVATVFARMKYLNSLANEKALIATSITNEFEEYKKKALDKQTKLSRELQNERNRIFESRK